MELGKHLRDRFSKNAKRKIFSKKRRVAPDKVIGINKYVLEGFMFCEKKLQFKKLTGTGVVCIPDQ